MFCLSSQTAKTYEKPGYKKKKEHRPVWVIRINLRLFVWVLGSDLLFLVPDGMTLQYNRINKLPGDQRKMCLRDDCKNSTGVVPISSGHRVSFSCFLSTKQGPRKFFLLLPTLFARFTWLVSSSLVKAGRKMLPWSLWGLFFSFSQAFCRLCKHSQLFTFPQATLPPYRKKYQGKHAELFLPLNAGFLFISISIFHSLADVWNCGCLFFLISVNAS